VFDLERAERIEDLTGIAGGALAVNADGSTIAIADAQDGAVTLVSSVDWQTRGIAGEKPVARTYGPAGVFPHSASLAFDGAGRLLVGRLNDEVDVIDPASATISATMAVPESTAHEAMTVGDSGIVIASGEFGMVAFDPELRRVRWSTEFSWPIPPEECNWIAVSEPMQRVYCGSLFGRISVFDLADGAPVPGEEIGPVYGDVGTIDVSADGAILTAVSGSLPIVTRWQLDGLGPGRRLLADGHALAGPYSFEGSSVVTAPRADSALGLPTEIVGQDLDVLERRPIFEGIVVVDTATGDVAYRFDEAVSDVGWAQDGRLYARSAGDRLFRIIDADTGREVGTPIWGVDRLFTSLGGARLHAVRDDGWILELDPRTGDANGESWRVEGFPQWISVAPGEDRIAVTHWSDGTPTDKDTSTSEREGIWLAILSTEDHRILYDQPTEIDAHVMLEDGELIGMDGARMGRYQTDPFERVGTVPGAADDLEHPSLSRDARTLLVMAGDGTALLYDTATGTRIGEPFPTDVRPLSGAVLDYEGRPIPVSMPDGFLRPDGLEMALTMPEGVVTWDLDPDHQLEFACRMAGRDLTENEWRTYLAELGDRRSTCGFD